MNEETKTTAILGSINLTIQVFGPTNGVHLCPNSIMEPNSKTGSGFDAQQITDALRAMSDDLSRKDITGEICIFGGTAMVLAFNARLSTKDVDAIFQPSQAIRESAKTVAEILDLPEDWINDGVKGFVSARHETTSGNLPQFPNLRLTMPVPEYLLAMKCIAARMGGTTGEPSDVADIVTLIRELKMTSAAQVLDLVSHYYPANQVSVKTQYLVEGLFEEGKI